MDTASQRILPLAATTEALRLVQSAADARPIAGEIGILRLLLATDLSRASEQATREAIRLAVEHGAQLVVLSVVDPRRLRLPSGLTLRRVDQERERIEAGVQRLVRRARAAQVRATFLVWEGDPAEAILAASDSEDVDMIVMGSHARGRLGRLVLGSISARVSEESRCRVMVVAG